MTAVLVVDDEPQIRSSLSALLASQGGFQVETAATAAEAVARAEQRPPDLLIADWMLADSVDGLQLARQLQAAAPNLSVILITGYLSDELRSQVKTMPNAWVLSKPCAFDDLMRTVRQATLADDSPAGGSRQ